MTANPFLKSQQAEDFRLSLGRLWSYFTITGNTTDASSAATTCNPAFKIFIEEGTDSGAPDTVDSGNGFATLDDDADPAVVGFLGMVGDAKEVYGLPMLTKISGDLTAATPSLAGASTSGVTASGNLAFTESMAGVDIDANTNVQKFTIEVFFRKG